MSFDANIGRSTPIIKAASNMNNDGGSGGNTGYMMRGRKKKEKDDKKSLFDEGVKTFDAFEMRSKLPKNKMGEFLTKESWIDKFINKFKQ